MPERNQSLIESAISASEGLGLLLLLRLGANERKERGIWDDDDDGD